MFRTPARPGELNRCPRVGYEGGMLRGDLVGLRAPQESDVPVLHAELHDDVETRSRTVSRAWRPIPVGTPQSPYAISPPTDDVAKFSVTLLADGSLAGEALLWGIDQHNRLAHIGLSLLPACRGRGLSTDVVKVLCHYGFALRGMHRARMLFVGHQNLRLRRNRGPRGPHVADHADDRHELP